MSDNLYFFYLILSFFLFFSFSKISYSLGLVAKPNKRSMHSKPVANTGGVVLCFIYLIASHLFNFTINKFDLILTAAFLIAIIGFLDDLVELSVGSKLSLQIIPIIYLIIIENFQLKSLGDYEYFKINLNSFEFPFTVLSVVFLINAFNYFDGLDGTLSFALISVLCILFFLVDQEYLKMFLTIILIPILIFMCFNFSLFNIPKLFLGDSGSMLLGFVFSFTLILLANKNLAPPILLAWSIVIFVYEFLSVNFMRIKMKKKIFIPGQDHLHHILFRSTHSVLLTNVTISLINIIFFIIGYSSYYFVNPLTSLLIFLFGFIIYFFFRSKFNK